VPLPAPFIPLLATWLAASPSAATSSTSAVARVDTDEPIVALTFDACATDHQANGFDRAVFDILARERIPVTMFLSGRWIEFHPNEARELAAQPWIELGNHAYRHPKLSDLSAERVAEEIDLTEAALHALGRKAVALRPPFGDWDAKVARVAEARGLPLVLWDVVSGDAGGHLRAERIIETVRRQTRPGSIIIFHINGRGPHTAAALPEIVRDLRARGLRFVTVSELLASSARRVAARPMKYVRRGSKRVVAAHPGHAG
jgi:peptidoglycan/xylan/chitin deacetylase (PgdA/CDA1 family)